MCDVLVLGGGGVRCTAMIGALRTLRNARWLDDMRIIVGTSAGAVLGAMLAVGMSPRECFDAVYANPFKPQFDMAHTTCALDTGRTLVDWIDAVVGARNAQSTLGHVYKKRGIRLVIATTNLTARRVAYFDSATHPTMPLRTALHMSCTIPGIFEPVVYQGASYVDGGVVANTPWHHALMLSPGRILALSFTDDPAPITNISTLMHAVMMTLMTTTTHEEDLPCRVTRIKLVTGTVSSVQFDLPRNGLRALYRLGSRQCAMFVKKNV